MAHTWFWWPLDLSPRAEQALATFRDRMQVAPVTIDAEALTAVDAQLACLMAQHLPDILERDSLPHLAHVVNGWGNARYQGHQMIEAFIPFVHRDHLGRPMILQCDPAGDFHPWQSFAYAIMAGVDPDAPLPPLDTTLRQLAAHSHVVGTSEGRELGHLLFALAHLDGHIDAAPFWLAGEAHDVPMLMELAVHAHHFGSFEVCRKFHLTEGLCAMAARVPGLEHYREDAQGFLDGQLDVLLLLGMILEEANELLATQQAPQADSLIQALRDSLVLGRYLEDHCFYAGHLIELACFAASFGYTVAPEHWNTMALVLNKLNAVLPAALPHVAFGACFLHLGHYRRAMTLLPEVIRARREHRPLTHADLARFTVDFDALADELPPVGTQSPPHYHSVFALMVPTDNRRAPFEAVIAHYAAAATPELQPQGTYSHFRRISPRAWPLALHYEFLDYGGAVGAEIHLESDAVLPLQAQLQAIGAGLEARFPHAKVGWDPQWWHGRGRVCVLFGAQTPPDLVAMGMHTLIAATYPALDAAARTLGVPGPSPWSTPNVDCGVPTPACAA